ncbi:hypothetical protein INP57_01155 [Saccharopolyspora sp. HNM0986]|uniref:hypothetical protein n=1 Tax=Saccharopolyspora galaxeae TaxID=2781241 RepID=UPI00190A8879|nr:hypothetical protein [Saccharopolyspora sp. HNM0986]MBK0865411.1 hypothetical protein [Saccharopolyspora sp. HNM0986]
MSTADAHVRALADQIAAALREWPARSASEDCAACQARMVQLAGCVGWRSARRLVLDRVRRGDPVEGAA